MGDQGGVGGLPGAPFASGLPDIAAARAIHWNVELDRGLRATKPGAVCEAIMKTGPRMLWWSQEPVASATTATLFKLEAGQDKTFANAMVQRLAESFRTGNNFTRLCILKVFLLVSKGSRPGDPAAGTGLLKKERIANYPEVLRRVKAVMDSGDAVARALALRMIGCLGEIAADSADVHRLVIEALQSPHQEEVEAALYAMGCLCELSLDFAQLAFQKVVDMVNAMATPPAIKLSAIRVFSKLGLSPSLSLEAHKAGKALMLRAPTTEILSTMLTSLTGLAAKSIITTESQVELLMAYLSSDPRATVRAVALQCLSKLALQASRSAVFDEKDFAVLLSVIEDSTAAPALVVLALQVLKKISARCIMTVTKGELHHLLSTIELTTLHHAWPVSQAALDCLVAYACSLTSLKPEGERETMPPGEELVVLRQITTREAGRGKGRVDVEADAPMSRSSDGAHSDENFAARVGLLLCDRLAMEGALTKGEGDESPRNELKEAREEFDSERLYVLHDLAVRLMRGCPRVAPMVIDSIAALIRVFTEEQLQEHLRPRNKQPAAETSSRMEIDTEGTTKGEGVSNERNGGDSGDLLENKLDFVLTLCHCLCASIRNVEANTARVVSPKILHLVTRVAELDPSCEILSATLPALLRVWKIQQRMGRDDKQSTESLVTKCADQMRNAGEFWEAYKVGLEAVANGFWAPVCTLFEVLAKKVQSEGCYLWLVGLSHLAKAEAILGNVIVAEGDDNKGVCGAVPASSEKSGPVAMDFDDNGLKNTGGHGAQEGEGGDLRCSFGDAAARAIPHLRRAGSSLAAGVCADRTFEFQRWLASIRLRMVQYVAELSRVLTLSPSSFSPSDPTSSREGFDIHLQNPYLEIWPSDVTHEQQAMSSFKSAGEKALVLSAQLLHLSKELDVLGLSFVGLDRESFQALCGAAVSCSMLAYCTEAVFSLTSPSGGDLSVQAAARDLHLRLRHVDAFGGSELLRFYADGGEEAEASSSGFGLGYVGPPDSSFVRLCGWAVKNVGELQKDAAVAEQHEIPQGIPGRAVHFLQALVGQWVQLPSPIPRFFVCTRPRTGVELSVAQTGGEEVSELSVNHGAALLLSLCVQVMNSPPPASAAKIKNLFCVLSVQSVESTSLVEEDLYAGWKLGWHEGEASPHSSLALTFPLLEKLVERARCKGAQEAVELEQELATLPTSRVEHSLDGNLGGPSKEGGPLRRSFVTVPLDGKGQGFASCILDVATLPCGPYQLAFHCVGLDTHNRPWILLSSHVRPSLKITPST